MTAANSDPRPQPAAQAWPELDLFRGLAVIAMIANHAVALWQGNPGPFSELGRVIFQIGGVAPVLFFFATGFGSGLQSLRKVGAGQHRYGLGRKVAILVLADQFIFWRWGVYSDVVPQFGLDFLGFIALSTLLVEPLRRVKHATTIALLGVAGLLFVRFALSPWVLPDAGGATDMRWFATVTGRAAVPGLAYPPFPWLIYPLLGFALGRSVGGHREALARAPLALVGSLAATAVGSFGAAYVMASMGLELNRYGIHSLAYLPIGVGAVACASALAWGQGLLAASPRSLIARLREGVSVRGVASLAVVPIHFALLFALGRSDLPVVTDTWLPLAIVVLTALCLVSGRAFGRLTEAVEHSGPARLAATAAVLFLVFATWWPLTTGASTRHGAAYAAQFALCGLLVWAPAAKPRKQA